MTTLNSKPVPVGDHKHSTLHLGKKKRGVDRIRWPWRFMRVGDMCDVYGDAQWRRHAASAAGGYISPHDETLRFRSVTATDTRGRKYLRVTAMHYSETPLPPLTPEAVFDPRCVALDEQIDALTDQIVDIQAAQGVLQKERDAIHLANRLEHHADDTKARARIRKPKTTETRDKAAERIEKARIKMSRKLAGKDDDRGQSEAKKIKAAQALREMNAQYRSNRGEGPADEDVFADLELPDIIPPRTR